MNFKHGKFDALKTLQINRSRNKLSVPEHQHIIFARLWRFYVTIHLIRQGLLRLWMFMLRAVRLPNKLLVQGYVKERLRLSLRKFMVDMGISSNIRKSPSPKYYMTFWDMITNSDTVHWSDNSLNRGLVPNLTLSPFLTSLHYSWRFP